MPKIKADVLHGVSATVKVLAALLGFAAFAHLIPGGYGAVAIAAFGLMSASKDLLTALQGDLSKDSDSATIAQDLASSVPAVETAVSNLVQASSKVVK
jgi:hypothetical protein